MSIIRIGKNCTMLDVPGIEYVYIVLPNDRNIQEYRTPDYSKACFQYKQMETEGKFDFARMLP